MHYGIDLCFILYLTLNHGSSHPMQSTTTLKGSGALVWEKSCSFEPEHNLKIKTCNLELETVKWLLFQVWGVCFIRVAYLYH